jgi:PIN domain nuclease of toxin-antitoxin system
VSLLIDTHILLWWPSHDPLLPTAARVAIASSESDLLVSAAAEREIAIKNAAGRLLQA